ncbi:popeye domain-containing protein 3-like [Patiria miniata]|uniref:POPDC1-3 domain-containing protein n=1 Tax=Patiria miniata TaxID=46514 RepID=A0A914BTV3_PATMI|nr:popeye domain-containing protein 3-like [Patiria miniata]XP_038079123.1 popeye domain-containing protein 3-like [Patiria miniata]
MEAQQMNRNDSNGWVNGPISCESWQQAQHAVYQLGCFIIANGFLVPPTVGIAQALWLRICLVLGLFCHVLWAGPALCWPDGLAWQLAAFFANVAHLVYLSYLSYPVSFDDDVQKVYQALFKPFNVSRQQFRVMLDSGGDIYELDRTGHYASEGRTRTDRVLSLLISGRMRVAANGRFLHHIYPTQFLDSLEWQGSRSNCGPSTFQVTVTADTDCRYIQWQKKALDKFLRKEGFIRAVFETTVGKDITTKLYSINEETVGPSAPKITQRVNKSVAPAPAQRVSVPEIAEICLPDEQEEDRGLLSHKWERALSIDEESAAGMVVGGGGATQQNLGGMSQLVVPRSGSVSSLHSVRSMVDIRASIASGRGADVAGRSSLTPGAAGDRSSRVSSMTSHTSEPMLVETGSKRSSFQSDHGPFPEPDRGETHYVSSV